jgi:Toastrack DUF4097
MVWAASKEIEMVMGIRPTLTILACVLMAGPALAAERTFDRHFTVSPGGHLSVDTDVGSVAITGGDGREVVVHADMQGPDDFLSRLDIQAAQDSQGVTVTGRLDHRAWLGWFDWFDWLASGQHGVRYTVTVPRDYPVDIRTSGGSLDVRHLTAAVRGTTAGGSITLRDVRGSINAGTAGGRIDGAELDGPTRLRTAGGSIEITDATGDLDVSTSGGGIHLERIDGKVRAMTSGGSVEAEMRANRGVSLGTAGGSITLLLPANAHGSIDAHTDGGRVDSVIPLSSTEIASRNELRGSINGGGELISLHTSGGSIHIAPLD